MATKLVTLGSAVLIGNLLLCTALRIEIAPAINSVEKTAVANISCHVDAQDADAKAVFILEIVKDGGQPLVFVRKSGISFGKEIMDQSKFQIQGLLATNIRDSYLTMSFLKAAEQDSGVYTCKMFYTDEAGNVKEHRASGNLTVQVEENKPSCQTKELMEDLSDLKKMLEIQASQVSKLQETVHDLKEGKRNMSETVSHLTNKVSDLQETVHDLKEENRNLSETVSHLADKDQEVSVADKISLLEVTSQNQSRDITAYTGRFDQFEMEMMQWIMDLRNKVTSVTAFSAGVTTSINLVAGSVVVFDAVHVNEGRAYNATTGVFTAPRAGLYAFHLVVHSSCGNGCAVRVHGTVNDDVVATLFAGDHDTFEQASVSFVRMLQPGDHVKAVVYDPNVVSNVYGGLTTSVFTGYLVTAV